MKPAAFDLYRPATVPQACDLLARHQGECRILAGGQTLIPTLAMRIATPGVLIDISAIESLQTIRVESGELVVPAMVRQAELERSLENDVQHLALAAVLPWVAHPPVRNRGTVCGSIAHADPSAELALVFVTIGGRVLAQRSKGRRFISADEFFLGTLQTSLEIDELIVEARFPLLRAEARVGFAEFGYRHGDFAVASVLLVRDQDGVHIGLGGIDDIPRGFHFPGLRDQTEAKARIRELAQNLDVRSDPSASAAFRRHLICSLGDQAINQAWA
jgi:2-furoyl-CoA dehydrogenase FAD binding subunit